MKALWNASEREGNTSVGDTCPDCGHFSLPHCCVPNSDSHPLPSEPLQEPLPVCASTFSPHHTPQSVPHTQPEGLLLVRSAHSPAQNPPITPISLREKKTPILSIICLHLACFPCPPEDTLPTFQPPSLPLSSPSLQSTRRGLFVIAQAYHSPTSGPLHLLFLLPIVFL